MPWRKYGFSQTANVLHQTKKEKEGPCRGTLVKLINYQKNISRAIVASKSKQQSQSRVIFSFKNSKSATCSGRPITLPTDYGGTNLDSINPMELKSSKSSKLKP